jgi:Na+-transporting NADH:ubiquinone oxidoreductase subunit D
MSLRHHLLGPLLSENPVTIQILGLCSALAVSRSLETALIMAGSVIFVLVVSNATISLLRSILPRSIRLILEVTIIASVVIVIDEFLRAFAPGVSEVLSVFVGLIITNCIVLGRAETFAMHNPVGASIADALGNGIGYALVLLLIAAVRELFGTGMLLGMPVLPLLEQGGWFRPNQTMLYAPSAFFLIGLLIWAVRSLRPEQAEQPDYRDNTLIQTEIR